MDVYNNEIFGPVLSVVRVDDVDAAIDLINANPYRWTAVSPPEPQHVVSYKACMLAWRCQRPCSSTDGIPFLRRMKDSLFGEHHVHGPEGVEFYTRAKVVTQRWLSLECQATLHLICRQRGKSMLPASGGTSPKRRSRFARATLKSF